ncbi:hypothetical protein EI16_08625 [Hydrogenovibrio marinus]|uniref:Uncharacterized protein n=1 Tax=Hydrogenovibrio marinus TaxID=28885 RepID=A0A066ZVN4_HYDMR|nr:hypothetical protein EI16_08625 [Hydrogenovibrio marinus]
MPTAMNAKKLPGLRRQSWVDFFESLFAGRFVELLLFHLQGFLCVLWSWLVQFYLKFINKE